MRVISGSARGCALSALEGDSTRPTVDRVKEAMFSAIQFDVYEREILDLFAGSGSLGIEALSRGAVHCDFIEQHMPAMEIVKANLIKARLYDRATLHITAAQDFLRSCNKKYGIVFLDPPYGKGLCIEAADFILQNGLLAENGIIVCETSASEELLYSGSKRYVYGKIAVTIIREECVK